MAADAVQLLPKFAIEKALHKEKRDIAEGRLKEDNPLDTSENFRLFCEACRSGDLKTCQEKISEGVNINARDSYDCTPLILASLCGHFETVQLLLESGALCERDTFQGERCLYNALTERIRQLLLSYNYSKATSALHPLTAHVSALLTKSDWPDTTDIILKTQDHSLALHKFLLAARSPFFADKLRNAPDTLYWKLAQTLPSPSVEAVVRYMYLGEVTADLGHDTEQRAILKGIDKLSRHLQLGNLFDDILEAADRRLARQIHDDQTARGRRQLADWYRENVLQYKMRLSVDKVDQVKWDRINTTFADILLRADELPAEDDHTSRTPTSEDPSVVAASIPVGLFSSVSVKDTKQMPHAVLYPVHRAILLRSDFFATMFSSGFKEAQQFEHLQVISIDCAPDVLEVVLTYLYTEQADFSLDIALEVLFAADMLVIEKLKQRAAVVISTLGSGSNPALGIASAREAANQDALDIYEIIRAGWTLRVHRLEEFGARYVAQRLEHFVDDPGFADIVKESASRITSRQETDTVELIDDIRYYLSERFRLRFEDSGLEAMIEDASGLKGDQHDAVVDVHGEQQPVEGNIIVNTLEDRVVGDDQADEAINYQILLEKIDTLLANLDIDA